MIYRTTRRIAELASPLSRRGLAASLTILFLCAGPVDSADEEPDRPTADSKVRGITISTHIDGRDWGWTEPMAATLEAIGGTGANWVAIHPYAGIGNDGSLRFTRIDPDAPPPHIAGPIRQAHEAGLKILVKPHLAYWGSKFSWRGAITFEREEEWERFWRDYESWILGVARAAQGADGFVVGTELDLSLDQEARWRGLIAKVRVVNSAPLTYASNWSDYDRVGFWDALDVIGIQAYFPLTDEPTTDEARIRRGWRRVMRQLRDYSKSQDRPIVFTEVGYSRSFRAPVEPWVGRNDGELAESVQQACTRAALEAIENEPSVVGSFLWKWFPEPRPIGRNYRVATPAMKELLREVWAIPPNPTPAASAE